MSKIKAEEHLKLVVHLANKMQARWNVPEEFDDLVGEGNVALVEAAKAFDEARGFAFSTYAAKAINNAMWEWIVYKRKVFVAKYCVVRVVLVINKFHGEYGRPPVKEELEALLERKIVHDETYYRYLAQTRIFNVNVIRFSRRESNVSKSIHEGLRNFLCSSPVHRDRRHYGECRRDSNYSR